MARMIRVIVFLVVLTLVPPIVIDFVSGRIAGEYVALIGWFALMAIVLLYLNMLLLLVLAAELLYLARSAPRTRADNHPAQAGSSAALIPVPEDIDDR